MATAISAERVISLPRSAVSAMEVEAIGHMSSIVRLPPQALDVLGPQDVQQSPRSAVTIMAAPRNDLWVPEPRASQSRDCFFTLFSQSGSTSSTQTSATARTTASASCSSNLMLIGAVGIEDEQVSQLTVQCGA